MINIPGEPNPVPNPAHQLWLRQDRLILQAIQASVAGSIAPLISSCTTAAEAWCKLQTTLANRSRTRMLGLLSNLMKTKQEGSTIADYLQIIKVIINDLALIGHSLSDEEVLIHTLNGLGGEYKKLTAALRLHKLSFLLLHRNGLRRISWLLQLLPNLIGLWTRGPLITSPSKSSKLVHPQ